MHENGTKFHKKLKGDIQLHEHSSEFHKKLKGTKMERHPDAW